MKEGYYIRKDNELGGYALYHHNLDNVPNEIALPDKRIGYGDTVERCEEIADGYEARGDVPFWRNPAKF